MGKNLYNFLVLNAEKNSSDQLLVLDTLSNDWENGQQA